MPAAKSRRTHPYSERYRIRRHDRYDRCCRGRRSHAFSHQCNAVTTCVCLRVWCVVTHFCNAMKYIIYAATLWIFLQPSSYCMRLNESLRRSSYLCQQGGGYVIVLSVILCALRRITHERRNGRRSKMAGMGRGRRGSRKKHLGGLAP